MTPTEIDKLLTWAQILCARREYSIYSITQKIYERGADRRECEQIVERLLDEHFIDELRLAKAFVHDKFYLEGWGRIKISYKLATYHRLSQQTITQALQQLLPEEELAMLEELLRTKISTRTSLTTELRTKLFRFAEQRGFTHSQIYDVLHRLETT